MRFVPLRKPVCVSADVYCDRTEFNFFFKLFDSYACLSTA